MNILCVDDHKETLELYKYLVEEKFNETFFGASTIDSGLDILTNETIDFVILDWLLAPSTGEQFLERMPEKIPVFVVTAMVWNNNLHAIDKHPRVCKVFPKTFDFTDLLRDIKSAIRIVTIALIRSSVRQNSLFHSRLSR